MVLLCSFFTSYASGKNITETEYQQCILQAVAAADKQTTIGSIKQLCSPLAQKPAPENEHATAQTAANNTLPDTHYQLGAISSRRIEELETEFTPYVITPHHVNYFLPVLTTSGINHQAYDVIGEYQQHLENIEAKFQLSFKVPLNKHSLFVKGDGLFLAFTLESWWQVYASNISKPFRESNYTPEIFYMAPLDWHPFGGNTGFVIGLEHQSNGKTQELSRSWNRIYGHFLFEKGDFALSFRPWYRLPEKNKTYPLDPGGDDNPDIADYMGHSELTMGYRIDDFEFGLMTRHNVSTNKGAAELSITFPMWGKIRGFATFFNGYGESLIDYNYKQTRFGIGIAINNML
ncbi:phospholipase A [Neptunicella marina]|uniref:Phospholipase A1 n=2 Tax=Neptunicella marina TaxID=2125989 RepID=A0A8J6IVG9_9ALTE|nr:phospholipase A [Neptunicella marina]MBC3766346.1 phospholipase A [Neptunicella marina]